MGGGGGSCLDPCPVGHSEPLDQVLEGQPPGVPAGRPGQLAAAGGHLGHDQAILEQKTFTANQVFFLLLSGMNE